MKTAKPFATAASKKKPVNVPGKPAKRKIYDTGHPPGNAFILSDTEIPAYELSSAQKIARIRSGISKKELSSIKAVAGLDYDTLAQLLSVGRATLINKKGAEKFNVSVSEKILALAGLYSYGYEVFDDVEKFNRWMKEPNLSIGDKRPIELADTLTGIEEIMHIIGRIEYGIFS